MVRQTRQNHALEHATIAVMLEKGAQPPLGGYSTPGGFFVFGRVSTEAVSEAAFEALDRLAEGQRELAISPYCGTNMVAGAVLTGLVTAVIMGWRGNRLRRIPTAAAAIIGASLVSRPLGNALQRRYTTLADPEGLKIAEVRQIWTVPYPVHRVRTRTTERRALLP